MRTIFIDCHEVASASDFWQRYLDAANPQSASLLGRNIDAFWDAIEHGGPGGPGEAKLVFANSAALATVDLTDGSSLLDGLRRIAEDSIQTEIKLP
ncbi:ribonuclease inhibitor [Sphingobium fontiphilum]|uniref:Ribonuclease inhibitor n=1 Tax=Sphingobium fontiphilum TaxID=944425 RepID=A0A7W6DEB7_9SPHN|nr:barstar family protein [Sphingobium fontiphilum]MBB3981142.1 ribonuclease inhibitor [Sphingobium fontiphilum]